MNGRFIVAIIRNLPGDSGTVAAVHFSLGLFLAFRWLPLS
jgi:hypothetical protein